MTMISKLPENSKKSIIDLLYTATAEKPATRQTLAEAANVERAQVGELLSELRLQGYLVLADGRGCWLATSLQELKEWRTATLIPTMVSLLQQDAAMYAAALMQFGPGRVETA